MFKSFLSVSVLFLSFIIMATALPAYAADNRDARLDAMEAQMMDMMAEIKALRAEREADKQEQARLRQKIRELESSTNEKLATISPAAGEALSPREDDVEISMKSSAPKFKKGEFEWQPMGRIHLDAGIIQDDAADHSNGAEFRRARLGMQGKVSKDFGYKAEVDFANEGVNIKDMYLNYTGVDNTEFRVGHFKPGYTLEDMTSSNDITFIERASVVDSFGTSENIGAGVITHGNNHHLAVGVFNDDAGTQSGDDEMWSVAGRLALAPVKEKGKVVHLGASAAYREPDQANDSFDLDATAENRIQRMDSVSSVITNGESLTVAGVEAAAVLGAFSAQGEYLAAQVENRGGQDPLYQGGYAQIAYTLTGESRPYDMKKGAFKGIKPDQPLDPSKGQYGALELAARLSHLDLNDNGLNGGEMTNATFGANWYLNDYVRLMANYIIVDTDDNAVTPDDDPHIMLLRSQVKF
jgi:phosphate-selective porin OprO/OprP